MTIQQIHYVLVIAERGSLNKATRCCMSRSLR